MMDNMRAFEEDIGFVAADDEPSMDAPPEIGIDERRMHVRAYNYWVSLLDGRPYPSISDLEPQNIDDFGPHSVLLDFSRDPDDPSVAFLGRELREECDLDGGIRQISDVPSRSLLSRLTDHYLQIIANCAPIGFEAEFVNHRGNNTMYRGILMPFSSQGDSIDFIYGVINWKEVADNGTAADISREVNQAFAASRALAASPVWADGPNSEPLLEANFALPAANDEDSTDQPSLDFELPDDAGLADRLSAARQSADAAKNKDARSRSALYSALGKAYDFALVAEQEPEDYAEILEDAGVKAQARAPMTPIVKLVFGADYDKTRLTEFAAALSFGKRHDIARGGLAEFLETFAGGLKGVVKAERQARRPEPRPDPSEQMRAALREAPPVVLAQIDTGDEEFVLLIARREEDGQLSIVAPVPADKSLTDRAIRKSAA